MRTVSDQASILVSTSFQPLLGGPLRSVFETSVSKIPRIHLSTHQNFPLLSPSTKSMFSAAVTKLSDPTTAARNQTTACLPLKVKPVSATDHTLSQSGSVFLAL